MSKSALSVVCDAGPLIHLDEMGCLALLEDFSTILVPGQVWNEVRHHRGDVLSSSDVRLINTDVVVSAAATFRAMIRTLSLDLGEQAALSLMEKNPSALFLTDDAAARLAATTLGYKVHGSIGILIRAIRREQLTKGEVLSILRDLPVRSTLHIRPSLIRTIIDKLTSD